MKLLSELAPGLLSFRSRSKQCEHRLKLISNNTTFEGNIFASTIKIYPHCTKWKINDQMIYSMLVKYFFNIQFQFYGVWTIHPSCDSFILIFLPKQFCYQLSNALWKIVQITRKLLTFSQMFSASLKTCKIKCFRIFTANGMSCMHQEKDFFLTC